MRAFKWIVALSVLCAISANAWGALVGTSVTGNFILDGLVNNFFDPSTGFVPSECLNSAGTTVTVADPAIEFCFSDPVNDDRANFSDTSLTITDVSRGGTTTFVMSFLLAPG